MLKSTEPPDRVGRYRITEPIGFGGMGEVFLAVDEKLGREVAIKTLPQMMIGDLELENRLRHEAETIARINHPSVGQIHDIVSENDRHFLVLEYVEGVNLAAFLNRHAVDIETAITLTAEISDGLAAAHAQGVVHRDLKPENIMVTPAGRAKILDFGLATVRPGDLEASHNRPKRQGLAGTLSAMSPEQAEGKTVEASSDLFSLGVLLYQMLTSSHPFRTSVPVETMQRIQSFDPPPPETLNNEIPTDLSKLTMQLLEKDPALRPGTAAIVGTRLKSILAELKAAARNAERMAIPGATRRRVLVRGATALLLIGIVVGGWWWFRPPPLPPFTVAVLKPTQTGANGNSHIPSVVSGLRFATVNALNTLEGAQVINTREIDAVSGSPRQIAHAVAADELITMIITPGETTVTVEIKRLSGKEDRLLWATRLEVPADNLRLLADTIAANIENAYPLRKRRAGAFTVTAEPEAYAAFLVTWKKVMNPAPDISWPETLAEIHQIRLSAPKLLNAAVLEASVARFLFENTNDESFLKQAADAVNAAKTMAPKDLRTLLAETEVAIAAGDHERARENLDELERVEPLNLAAAQQRARLARKRGDAEGARAILARMVVRRPSWKNWLNLAKVERFLGDTEAARAHLDEAARRAPDTLLVMVDRAHLELMSGDPEKAEALLLQIVATAPGAQNLTNLGLSQLLLHRYEEALMNFERAFALGSKSTAAMLNLADCHQLLNNTNLAQQWYERTITTIPEGRPMLADDLEVRAQALAQLGRTAEAAHAIRDALEQDPDSPYVLYAAALTYSVSGQEIEAREYTESAIKAGINRRWFDLPWFSNSIRHQGPDNSSQSPQTATTIGE